MQSSSRDTPDGSGTGTLVWARGTSGRTKAVLRVHVLPGFEQHHRQRCATAGPFGIAPARITRCTVDGAGGRNCAPFIYRHVLDL